MTEPVSHWQATSNTALSPDVLPAHAEIVVVGGGLHGVSAAYWLARMGARPVLIERGALAAGATGRNGGLVVAGTAEDYPHAIARLGHTAARTIYQSTIENHALLLEVLREEQINADYRDVGHLKLALHSSELAAQHHAAALLRADGFAVQVLDRAQTQKQIAMPLGEEIAGSMVLPNSGTVHSARLVQGLAQAAQRRGARIVPATEVYAIEPNRDGVQISTAAGVLHANRSVVALNAWSGTLLPALAKVVTPVRGQALAYEPIAPVFRTGCSAELTPTGEYWHQTAAGTIVIGGCRTAAADHDVGMRPQTASTEVQAAIETILPRLFPQLPPLRVARRWAGMMAFTPDYTPIVDRVPELPGAWAVGGFSGHGMPFGMVLGRALAHSVLEDAPVPLLAPFGLGRASLRS